MQPWDMDERPVPPDAEPSWYERLAPYGAGAAVLIAIYLVLVLIEQSGVGLAFVLFLGTLVALGAGVVWLLLTLLDWLGVPLVLRVRDVATRAVFVLGVLCSPCSCSALVGSLRPPNVRRYWIPRGRCPRCLWTSACCCSSFPSWAP